MGWSNFENLGVYQLSERIADEVWKAVIGWDNLARDTVGSSLFALQTVLEPISLKAKEEVPTKTIADLSVLPVVH